MLEPARFSQLRWVHAAGCLGAMIGAVVLIGLGLVGKGISTDVWLVVAGGFVFFAALMWMTLSPLLVKVESNLARQLSALRDLSEELARQTERLDAVVKNTQLSDAAKSLARRHDEVEALRATIREDVRNEHWEAALNLIDEMERRFGYKQEAARIREELDEGRRAAMDAKLAEAIDLIEGHFRKFEWSRAQKEIDRLKQILPEDDRVAALQDRLKDLQDEHKKSLRADWDEAVRRSDTDHAIDVLRELDQYLTPLEAQQLQASARNVFKEKLLQLGVQFRFAVTEKRWQDALQIGLELVRDFPNARMANEVREVLDTLRERARAAMEHSPSAAAHARL